MQQNKPTHNSTNSNKKKRLRMDETEEKSASPAQKKTELKITNNKPINMQNGTANHNIVESDSNKV